MAKYFFEHAVTRNWTIPTGTTTMRLENINLANYLPQYIGRSFWSFFGHFAYFDHLSTSFCSLMGISFFFSVCGFVDADAFSGNAASQGFQFTNYNLKELFFTNGIDQFPQEAFTPSYAANGDHWREFESLFSCDGIFGVAVKSDWGLARVSSENYAENFCLYRVCTSKVGQEMHEIAGPSFQDVKENSANLDVHISFTAQTPSVLQFLIMMVFHDSFELGMSDTSERDIIKSYNH